MSPVPTRSSFSILVLLVLLAGCRTVQQPHPDARAPQVDGPYPATAKGVLPHANGFRGIWYSNQPQDDAYRYKYSGGLATYPQQHHPLAIYAPTVDRTFFVYGAVGESGSLLHAVSYFDHATGRVARPRILLDKGTTDAHDNPTLQLDPDGYLWIFSNAHGTSRPSYVHRSRRPYDVSAFDLVWTTNFSYGQPWYVRGQGFALLHTRYGRTDAGRATRELHVLRSPDGRSWSNPTKLASMAEGHYQVSWQHEGTLGTAFNMHPEKTEGPGLNWRTNLYYLATTDGGQTWQTVDGHPVALPITTPDHPALVHDYAREGRLVYLKGVTFTPEGWPILLYLTSAGYASGPANDPRTFTLAYWDGAKWTIREITDADNNYDFAALYAEPDGTWRLFGTTEPGPQRYNTGGEMALWTSTDEGRTWTKKQLTHTSPYNHTYPRRVLHAHPGFYAFWADGHGREPSESRLYFTDRDGTYIWRLPPLMTGETAQPELVR